MESLKKIMLFLCRNSNVCVYAYVSRSIQKYQFIHANSEKCTCNSDAFVQEQRYLQDIVQNSKWQPQRQVLLLIEERLTRTGEKVKWGIIPESLGDHKMAKSDSTLSAIEPYLV